MLLDNCLRGKIALFYIKLVLKMHYNCTIFEIYVVSLLSTGER